MGMNIGGDNVECQHHCPSGKVKGTGLGNIQVKETSEPGVHPITTENENVSHKAPSRRDGMPLTTAT